MQNEKISVIIPIYGVEKYLNRCVDSVIAQTYENIEIILVDDGSPDACGKMCDEYAKQDNRIIVIHKENGGLSDARNVGIEKATGEWLVFIDSDDCVAPIFVEKLYSAVKEKDCLIAQCNYARFSDGIPDVALGDSSITLVEREEILKNIDSATNTAAWNKIYKTDLFRDIQFPKGRIHEDVATTYKLFYKAQRICCIDAELYYYFVNPESITTSKIKANKLDLIDAYREQVEFFRSKDDCGGMFISASNRLTATFGTLASYSAERYENYQVFYQELLRKYKKIRPFLKTLPLRKDLQILVFLSRNSLALMKFSHKLKIKLAKRSKK